MSARGPALVALAVALTGAIVATEGPDETPTATQASARPGVDVPALADDDVLASTWYCAAGTAAEDGMADHTVVVFNPGDAAVRGTLTVRTGSFAAPPAADEVTERAEELRAEDEASAGAAGEERSAGGGAGLAQGESAAPAMPAQQGDDEGESGDEGGDDESGDEGVGSEGEGDDGGEGDQGSVGEPWEGEGDPAGAPVEEAFTIEPGARYAVRLGELVEAPLAAALVEAGGPVAVEHSVAGPDGRDTGPCASSAAPEWHLAWGATTRGARDVVVLFNPFPSVTTVDVVFTTSGGIREPLRYQGLPVPAGGVIGLDIGDEVDREDHVSTTVRSRSGPLVVERLQSFDGEGSGRPRGLSLALGAPRPLEAWAFAHGLTGDGRREWLVVYNPTEERAEVEVAVVPPAGEDGTPPPTPFGLTVRARGYETLAFDREERVPGGVGHATLVRSTNGVPVVVERVLSAPAPEGDDEVGGDMAAAGGSPVADRTWAFATLGDEEGQVGYLVAYNPDPQRAAHVTVTGSADGEPVGDERHRDIEVAPGQRREIRLNAGLDAPGVGLVAESDLPVVVERVVNGPGRVTQVVGPGIVGGRGSLDVADVDLAPGD
jgi:hypothetical protein